jgi:glucose/arabinose dehydrogenase
VQRLPIFFFTLILAAILLAALFGAATLATANPAIAPLPEHHPAGTFTVEPFVPTITFPADITFAPDGLLYVAERFVGAATPVTGAIRVVSPDGALQSQPFAVVTLDDSTPFAEKGLLGLVLDPNYAANGFVYAYYTAPPDNNNAINHGELVRYTAIFSAGNWIGTQKTVLVDDLPVSTSCCHNGGKIGFGPDGLLYLSIGDNSNSGNGQDLSTAAATILRFNPDGSIPAGNPFTQTMNAHPAIYAYGLRNSFGFDWHPLTGAMFATENGPNCNDELNHIISGGNYGWAAVSCDPHGDPYLAPIWVVDPPEGLTGAAFYTPPAALEPYLYVTNWNNGDIYQIGLDDDNLVTEVAKVVENCGQPAGTDFNGLSLAVSPAGELYLACQQEFFPAPPDTGAIFRIVYTGDIPPTAAFTASPQSPVAGREVQFTNLSQGTDLTFTWDFGDGTTVSNATHPVHTYTAPGIYTVTLTATNSLGSDTALLPLPVTTPNYLPAILRGSGSQPDND